MTDTSTDDIDGFDRRGFLKRVGVVGAFAVPAIATFSMTGLGEAFGSPNPLPPRGANLGGDQASPAPVAADPAASPTTVGTPAAAAPAPAGSPATATAPRAATSSGTRGASTKPRKAVPENLGIGSNSTSPIPGLPGLGGNQGIGAEIESLLQQLLNLLGFGRRKKI